MVQYLRFSGVLMFFVLAAVSGRSEEISLAECLSRASTRSPQAVQADLDEVKAQAAYAELGSQRLPRLSAEGTYSKTDDSSTALPDANKGVLRVEQSVFPFSSDWSRGEQKAAEWKAARFDRLESQLDVALMVKELYFSILRDQDAVASFQQGTTTLEELLMAVIPRYQTGRVLSFDVVKVKATLADLVRNRNLTRAQLIGEKSRLALMLAMKADALIELKPVLKAPQLTEFPSLKSVTQANPSLQSLTEQTHAAELGLQAANFSRLPSLFTAFEYGYSGQTADTMTRGWDLSAGLKFRLFDWGEIGAQANQEQAALSKMRAKAEEKRESVSSDLIQARAEAEAHLADQVRLKPLLPELKQAAAASVARYRRGAMSVLEATDFIGLWLGTLLNERTAFYAYLTDLARIEKLENGEIKAKGLFDGY